MLGDIAAGPAYRITQWLELVRKRSSRYHSSGFPHSLPRFNSMPFRFVSTFCYLVFMCIEMWLNLCKRKFSMLHCSHHGCYSVQENLLVTGQIICLPSKAQKSISGKDLVKLLHWTLSQILSPGIGFLRFITLNIVVAMTILRMK